MHTENQVLKQVANEAVSKEHIISYLDVVKNNLNLSVLNQAMVYLQRPTAKMVCGKKAWESLGRTIAPNALPIVLFFPTIRMTQLPEEYEEDGAAQVMGDTDVPINRKEPVFENNYIPVNAFDYDSTTGDAVPDATPPHETFANAIMEVTGADIETTSFTDGDAIRNEYKYDSDENIFYISNNLKSDSAYTHTLVYGYLDYIFTVHHVTDVCLKAAIKYVVNEHYHLPNNIAKPIFRRLDTLSEDEKLNFMRSLQYYVSGIIQDFEGYSLSFNETAFINDLFYTLNPSAMHRIFDKAISSLEDDLLKDDLFHLREKLMHTDDSHLKALLSSRAKKEIYTYPPYKLHLDKTDYLKNAREELSL